MDFSDGDKRFIREAIRELAHYFYRYINHIYAPMRLTYKQLYWFPGESKLVLKFIWLLNIPLGLLCLYWRLVDILLVMWFGGGGGDDDDDDDDDNMEIGPQRLNTRKDRFMCIDYT